MSKIEAKYLALQYRNAKLIVDASWQRYRKGAP